MSFSSAIADVFLAAVDIEAAADRAAWLDDTCRDQPEVRQEVERLLVAHRQIGDFLEAPPTVVGDLAETARFSPPSALSLDFLSPPTRPDSLGRLGHYEILEVVGSGGMGVVFKAFDEKLGRVVAIKAMSEALAASDPARQQFVREARSAAAVHHDHVVIIFDVSEANGVPFLVMELIAGESLQERLDRDGPLDVEAIRRIGIQTASALAAAHDQGLVHRDIKPANILLERALAGNERVKIADFGLARTLEDSGPTREGMIAGTPAYMSPEQVRGQPVDHRSDLFSLGSVLYAMCTGRPPFASDGRLAMLRRITDDSATPVEQLRPETPSGLIELIRRLHAKDPGDRPQSAAEVQALLTHCKVRARWTESIVRRISGRKAVLIGGGAIVAALAAFRIGQLRDQRAIPVSTELKQVPSEPGDFERETAQWVRSMGGELMLADGDELYKLTSKDPLPSEPFDIHRVGLTDRFDLQHADFERLGQLTRLRILELGGTSVTDDDLEPIGRLRELEDLDLGRTQIGDQGVQHLAEVSPLYVLHLYDTRITNEALRVVARNPKLLRLYLSGTEVDDTGIEYLKPLKLLRSLDLRGTKITDRCLTVFGAMDQLEELRLEETRVTPSAVESLQRQLPNCQIRY